MRYPSVPYHANLVAKDKTKCVISTINLKSLYRTLEYKNLRSNNKKLFYRLRPGFLPQTKGENLQRYCTLFCALVILFVGCLSMLWLGDKCNAKDMVVKRFMVNRQAILTV
jgi:hypothetical protein